MGALELIGLPDLMGALFPCGSVTGAPKIRAMEAIAELEPSRRGPYCGAIGYLAPGPAPSAHFNVAIRTVVIDPADGSAVSAIPCGATKVTP